MPTANRNYWIDNLRSFITILVLAHHAALAYTTFAYFDNATYINSTHPVVDSSRWVGMDIFVSFNDIFFMPLMFLISGLFFFGGLQKKGRSRLLLDRMKRLGIPFLVAELIVIPLAYIPSYLLVNHRFSISDFITDYLVHQQWPVGPPWFIWLLLAFNALAALLPERFFTRAGQWFLSKTGHPFQLLLVCFLVAGAALIPLSLRIGQYTWTGFGPFDFQLNRVIFYFVFFLFGAVLGTVRWEDHLFHDRRLLGKRTVLWVALSACGFLLIQLMTFQGYAQLARYQVSPAIAALLFLLLFVATCLLTCCAFMAVFASYLPTTSGRWQSLSTNAYGMYLIHYVFITWPQYAFLQTHLPATIKFSLVLLISVAASWYITHLLRRIRMVARWI